MASSQVCPCRLDLKASGLDIAKARDFATDLHRTAAGKLDLFSDGRHCGAISPVDHHLGSMFAHTV